MVPLLHDGMAVDRGDQREPTISATDESRTRPRAHSHGPGSAPAGRNLQGR